MTRLVYTIREAAELLGVSARTLRRWIAAGDLRAFCPTDDPKGRNGAAVRISRAELERFFAERSHGAPLFSPDPEDT